MSTEKHFTLRPITASLVLLSLCTFLTSCTNPIADTRSTQTNFTFTGDWQGNGVDSGGNEFTFAAKVRCLGDNKYQILILDRLDTTKRPLHVMEGELTNNKFTYTADEGLYTGGGELSKDTFEGFYKGPVDGTYKMSRISNSEMQ